MDGKREGGRDRGGVGRNVSWMKGKKERVGWMDG